MQALNEDDVETVVTALCAVGHEAAIAAAEDAPRAHPQPKVRDRADGAGPLTTCIRTPSLAVINGADRPDQSPRPRCAPPGSTLVTFTR